MADNYRFDIPTHHKSIIKVMGVGGGGSRHSSGSYDGRGSIRVAAIERSVVGRRR